MNVIDFEFFGFNVSIWVPSSPLGPKSHDILVELIRFKNYVERNKVHFAPFLRFHGNHYIDFLDFSDVSQDCDFYTKKG